ncbi:MAG: putative dynein beta chain [Streblomastix strix]|uniref:Putative dynein beta chain n=1 Tax=Streblomastix strix TaxID=222440 RepID=A0A5J4UPE2_9EUKA|nr:MAG: putative dynein beta chain [Streblomastix strix]
MRICIETDHPYSEDWGMSDEFAGADRSKVFLHFLTKNTPPSEQYSFGAYGQIIPEFKTQEAQQIFGKQFLYKMRWIHEIFSDRRISLDSDNKLTETIIITPVKVIGEITSHFKSPLNQSHAKEVNTQKTIFSIERLATEVQTVQKAFTDGNNNPAKPQNLSPLAECLWTVYLLTLRIKSSTMLILHYVPEILTTGQGREVKTQYDHLLRELNVNESEKYKLRARDIDLTSAEKLDLLRLREEDSLDHSAFIRISINFNPALVVLLREFRYFQSDGIEAPPDAQEVYALVDVFLKHTATLKTAVEQYHWLADNMISEEEALIAHELNEATQKLEPELQQLNWKSKGAEEFLKQLSESNGELYRKLTAEDNNLSALTNKLKSWAAPMMKRDPKSRKMFNIQDVKDRISARVNEIKKGSQRLQKLVEQNRVLFSDINSQNDAQINYQKMVKKLIIEGQVMIVRASMEHLKKIMGASHDEPSYEVKLLLQKSYLDFVPSISS